LTGSFCIVNSIYLNYARKGGSDMSWSIVNLCFGSITIIFFSNGLSCED
jgi:hypothetical protein